MYTCKKNENGFAVLIPDGESWLGYSVLSCLARIPGVKVVILSSNPTDPLRFSRFTHQFFSYSPQPDESDADARLAAICDIVSKINIDVVLPVDTETMRLLSKHKTLLEKSTVLAPLPKVAAIDIASDKWLLARWLKKHNIPCPETVHFDSSHGVGRVIKKLSFPVLLKPSQQADDMGIGGKGIEVFDCPAALIDYCQDNETDGFIAQSYISGYDIDCSVLCCNGKIQAHTIQKGFMPGASPFAPPAGIELLHDEQAYQVVKDLVAKMHWTGVAHFDLRYDEHDQQVKVIEINPRFWGSLFGSVFSGVNFPYLTCLAGLGREIKKTSFQPLRYVNGVTAVNLFCRSWLQNKQPDTYFDYSALNFMVKDPLPRLVAFIFGCYKKMLSLGRHTQPHSWFDLKNKGNTH